MPAVGSWQLVAVPPAGTVPEFQVVATVAAYAEVLRDSRYVEANLDQVFDEALELPLRELEDPAVDEFIGLLEPAVRLGT